MSEAIEIWRDMLKAGADPGAIRHRAETHLSFMMEIKETPAIMQMREKLNEFILSLSR